MIKLFFKIAEFCISSKAIPQRVADAILTFHILPMQPIRVKFNKPIYVSLNSGYRPLAWELKRGRSGKSEHTFKVKHPKGIGAVDYRAEDLEELLGLLILSSPYTRICYYPLKGFIHCDYKPPAQGSRSYYEADINNNWIFKNVIEI